MNGSLPYFPVGDNPSGVVVSPKGTPYVYVIDQEKPSTGSPYGVLVTFAKNSDGSLTLVPGSTASGSVTGVQAGTTPAAIAEDPTGQFLYVTDETTNQLYFFQTNTGSNGVPTAPFNPNTTGDFPEGVTVDPRGEYVYVANFGSSSVSAFAINQSSGALSSVAGSAGVSVATGPTCVTIEPALGVYLFSSNNLDGSVSGEKIKPETGALTEVQGSQFPASALPTCLVSVANGAHATQLVD
jgi:6-phosphogluconolactonase